MPQVKVHNSESLKKMCVKYVVNNMDYWCNRKSPNEIDILRRDTPEEELSSFELLPLPVFKAIIALLQKNWGTTIECLKLFLTYHLDSLKLLDDYEGSKKNENILVVNLASVRCLQMKSLQIPSSRHYGDDFMAFVIPKFANLQVLNISGTSAGDITLQLLGKYCKNLKELIAEDCYRITDAGMQGLCVSVDHLGKEVEGIGQCKLLEHLATDDTSITSVGVKLGIRNLPKLKRWKMVSVQLLAEVYQEDSMSNKLLEIPKYSLIHLELKGIKYTSGSLGLAVSMCPFVTQVNIVTIKSFTDSDLQALLSLKSLHELKFNDGYNYKEDCEITFSGGVTPLLKAFGSSSLKFLLLSNLPQVNIDVIIQHCPNLHSLTLDRNYHYSTANPEEEQVNSRSPMMQLEKLFLSTDLHSSWRIPTANILSLISIPCIKKISCFFCPTITDEILKQADRLHHFKNLETFQLVVCAPVSKKGIDVLMDSRNAIKVIDLIRCDNITFSDICAWRKQASSNNWDLSIRYRDTYENSSESEHEMVFDEVFVEIGANVA